MAEFPRDRRRRLVRAEGPDIDRAAGARIPHREEHRRDGRPDRPRSGVQDPRHRRAIPERGRQQDVGGAAAPGQLAGDVRPVAHHPLRRGRLVIDVARVDLGAAIEQEVRHRHGLREVERQLPIPAARVDQAGISGQHAPDVFDHSEPHRMVDLRHRPAADEERRHPRRPPRIVEDVEPAGPPVAFLVDVGAGAQQHVGHLAVLPLDRGEQRRLAEGTARGGLVDPRLQLRVLVEHARHGRGVVGLDGVLQRIGGGRAHRGSAGPAHGGMRKAPIFVE